MAKDEEKPIRIVDRRMFTPEGELRPDFQAEESPEPAPAGPASALTATAGRTRRAGGPACRRGNRRGG